MLLYICSKGTYNQPHKILIHTVKSLPGAWDGTGNLCWNILSTYTVQFSSGSSRMWESLGIWHCNKVNPYSKDPRIDVDWKSIRCVSVDWCLIDIDSTVFAITDVSQIDSSQFDVIACTCFMKIMHRFLKLLIKIHQCWYIACENNTPKRKLLPNN